MLPSQFEEVQEGTVISILIYHVVGAEMTQKSKNTHDFIEWGGDGSGEELIHTQAHREEICVDASWR